MTMRCKKCGLVFSGIKCRCGWSSIAQKKPSNYYMAEAFEKGHRDIAEKNIARCFEILGVNRLKEASK